MIIAIDGPAGSGKSTTARAVAERLGYLYLDTGAMYRAAALAFMRAGRPATPEAAAAVLPTLDLGIEHDAGQMRVLLGGEDVSEAIRTQEVGEMASQVSALPPVREKLMEVQQRLGRAYARTGGVVLDGRDIGTVVFPEAEVKIFLVANTEERARRRVMQLEKRGETASLDAVRAEIEARDTRDTARAVAPLRKADDAVVLDTTRGTIADQVQFVLDQVAAHAAS